jgi:hypothetical protein
MSTKEIKKTTVANEATLESWIPPIIPALRTRWANYATSLPAGQPAPRMSDWLTLLHTAAVNPAKIPHYLSQLLDTSQNDIDPQKKLGDFVKVI